MAETKTGPETSFSAGCNNGLEQPVKADDQAAAVEAINLEHELTFVQAVNLYPVSIFWSCFVSLGVIMTAFDPQLLGNLYAMPQFERDFGYVYRGEVSLRSL